MRLTDAESAILQTANNIGRQSMAMPMDPDTCEGLVRLGFMTKVTAMGFTIYAITETGREAARRGQPA